MQYLLIGDIMLSLFWVIFSIAEISPLLDSVSPIVASVIYLLFRSSFVHYFWQVWQTPMKSDIISKLKSKNYLVEILFSVFVVMSTGALGWFLWSGFYFFSMFFTMWLFSNVIECVFVHNIRIKE